MYEIITYKSSKDYPLGSFFIQSKGLNAGRPSYSPKTNCWVITTNDELLNSKYLYFLCLALYSNKVFKNLIIGSAIPFLPLYSFKKTLNAFLQNHSFNSDKTATIKKLQAIHKAKELSITRAKKLDELSEAILRQSFLV